MGKRKLIPTCCRCDVLLTDANWRKSNQSPLNRGRRRWFICEDCLHKDWVAKHEHRKEVERAYTKIYRARPEIRQRIRFQRRQYYRRNYYELKRLLFDHYSGGDIKCACCGEREIVFLSLDHIVGSSKADRKRFGDHFMWYRWLVKNGYPPSLQVLCMNCNWGRRYNGICPHRGVVPLTKLSPKSNRRIDE